MHLFFPQFQAAKQAAPDKAVVREEIKEVSASQQVESVTSVAGIKVPVGRTMSSIHVDYNCFEIGTGQVQVPKQAVTAPTAVLLHLFYCHMGIHFSEHLL